MGGDTLSLNTLVLFEVVASLQGPISSRQDTTPFQPCPVFHGSKEEITIEVKGQGVLNMRAVNILNSVPIQSSSFRDQYGSLALHQGVGSSQGTLPQGQAVPVQIPG